MSPVLRHASLATLLAASVLVLSPRPAPAEDPTPPASVASFRALDLDGTVRSIPGRARATVVVFLGAECPISNRYVPELNQLARAHAGEGVVVHGVFSSPHTTRADALTHRKRYGVEFPVLLDTAGDLALRFRPEVTPEAFVLAPDGQVLYRGRIDDAWFDLTKRREAPTTHDLEAAVAAVVAGEPVPCARTKPVGCLFEAWPPLADSTLTYARDVAPILQANCAHCHHDGGIGPFPLATFADAKRRARTIARATGSRLMPPWHANPGFGRFLDERRLSERQIETIAEWVRTGAREGDAADLPPPMESRSGWTLGEPDLVLTMPQAFEIPADGPDIYRVFVLDAAALPKDEMVVASEFRPGAPSVVHHCHFFLDSSGKARELEAKAGGNGYPNFGGLGFSPAGTLGGWAPGANLGFLPEGMGRRFEKGWDVVFQIHYHPTGKVEHDRSSLALWFARKPVTKIVEVAIASNHAIDIPAGEARYRRTCGLTLPCDVTMIGIVPHMHLLGRSMKAVATLPSGEKVPLIDIADWDFKWQDQYQYAVPFRLPKGTRLSVEAVYDNSADNPRNPSSPPRRVTEGEGTEDEMCYCFFGFAFDDVKDLAAVWAAIWKEEKHPAPTEKAFEARPKKFF